MEIAATQHEGESGHDLLLKYEPGKDIQASDIYSLLANKDCFQIFCLASDGIRASTRVLQDYKFTKKRYYGRLRQLIRIKLVLKEGRFYRHTALGRMIYENQVRQLQLLLSGAFRSI